MARPLRAAGAVLALLGALLAGSTATGEEWAHHYWAFDRMTPEEWLLGAWINGERAWNGQPTLLIDADLASQAQLQADRLAACACGLWHSPTGELHWWLGRGWAGIGENVGYGGNVWQVHQAMMRSPPHTANTLDPLHRGVGAAIRRDPTGRVWVAVVYGGF